MAKEINVLRTGFKGINDPDDHALLQDMIDSVPDGSRVIFPPGEYLLNKRLFIRRNKITMIGDGARLTKEPEHNISGGTLLQISNCNDIIVTGLEIDVQNSPENAISITGNNTNENSTVVQPAQYCNNILIENIRAFNATFGINKKEDIEVADATGFVVDEDVRSFTSNGRLTLATVVAIDLVNNILTVMHKIAKPSIGRIIVGLTSGAESLVTDLISFPVVDPYSGQTYNSNYGEFGGKGVSVQFGVRSACITGLQTKDCAIGFSIESKALEDGESSEVIVTNSTIVNADRTPMWIVDASDDEGASIQSCTLDNISVRNWGKDYAWVGVITADRASNVFARNIVARMDSDYEPLYGTWITYGSMRNCNIEIFAEVHDITGICDFRAHTPWGSQPGPNQDSERNNIRAKVHILGDTATSQTYDYTLQDNTVEANMIDWEPNDELVYSTIEIDYKGWSTADFFLKDSVTSRYRLYNLSTGFAVSGPMSENPVFDSNYREKVYGNGTNGQMQVGNCRITGKGIFGSGASGKLVEVGLDSSAEPYVQGITNPLRVKSPDGHVLARFEDGGAIKFGSDSGGQCVQVGLDTSDLPYVRGLVDGLLIKSPDGTTIARVEDNGFRLETNDYTKPFRLGSRRIWASSAGHIYVASSNPTTDTDGWQLPSRWGVATKSAGFTYTAGSEMPVILFSGQTANETITLSTSSVGAGTRAVFVRSDAPAYTLAIGSVFTIPASTAATVEVIYGPSGWTLLGVQAHTI